MNRFVPVIIGGIAAGATLAGAGLVLAPDADTPVEASVTTVAAVAPAVSEPWWFSPSETRIGPTAILVESIDFENGQVVVRYELRDISPPALGRVLQAGEINPFFAPPAEESIAAPERWVLETIEGEVVGSSENTRVRAVRFDVADDFVLGKITGLRVESYRMRMPYVYDIDMPGTAGTRLQLDEGFVVEITAVLPQAESTIFQLDYEIPSDEFTQGEPNPVIIRGVGTEWQSYNQRQFEGLQLIFGSKTVPDPLTLEFRTTYWVPFETSIPFDLGGARG